MQGLTRRWKLGDGHRGPAGESLLARVLAVRGLDDPSAIEGFLTPSMGETHDPGLLAGIDAAAGRLVEAVRNDEPVVIYGDYDVDGITATAILWHVIRTVAPDAPLRSYVPHRLEEGYGLNADALRSLAGDGAAVIVSVDCGITAIDEAELARELGVDLIITDHHTPATDDGGNVVLPAAHSIVHPGLPGGDYPTTDLCGAGVAFKLACRFARTWCGSDRVSTALQHVLTDSLSLVALGTIADVMPLTGENRVLAGLGLRRIRSTKLAGLQALIEASGLAGEDIDTEGVGFRLAPRINAAGRMGHASEAVQLLTEADGDEAESIAAALCTLNDERQRTEREILEQAIEMAKAAGMTEPGRRIIVLAHPDWHVGVLGIVCSRLVERFGRPAILMQEIDGLCRGSARSIDGYSIHEGLTACREHLVGYGGHAAAAGLSLDATQLGVFTDAITTHANAAIGREDLVPWLVIDADAALSEIDAGPVLELDRMAPFGRGNARPRFRIRDLRITEIKPMGRDNSHLSLRLAGDGGRGVRAVWWKQGERADALADGMRVDVVARANLNRWRNNVTAELEILDLAPGSS